MVSVVQPVPTTESSPHAEFLRRVTLDSDLVRRAPGRLTDRAISEADRRAGLRVQLTKDATRISKPDHEKLHAVGSMQSYPADHAHRFLVQLHQSRRRRPV